MSRYSILAIGYLKISNEIVKKINNFLYVIHIAEL